MAFKENLTILMNLFKLGNNDLSKGIHIDASVISRWKTGGRHMSGNSPHLYNIARFFLSLNFNDYQDAYIERILSRTLSLSERKNMAMRIKALMDWLIKDHSGQLDATEKAIIDKSPVAIAIVRFGRLIIVNSTFRELFRCSATEGLGGRQFSDFFTLNGPGIPVQPEDDDSEGIWIVPGLSQGYGLRADGHVFHAEIEVEPVNLLDGPALSVFIFDVTDKKYLENKYMQQLAGQQMLLDISKSFTRSYIQGIDDLIDSTLMRIGRFDGSDRAFIYLMSEDRQTISNTYEWCAEGYPAFNAAFQSVPITMFPWWTEHNETQDYIFIPDISALPDEAVNEKTFLMQRQVKSLLTVPIIQEGQPVGLIGLGTIENQKIWSDEEISLLEFVAQIIANSLAQKKYYNDLKLSGEYYKTMFNTGDAKIIVDNNRKVLQVNRQFELLMGIKNEDIIGRLWTDFSTERAAAVIDSIDAAEAGIPAVLPSRFNIRYTNKSGKELYLQLSVANLPAQNAKLVSFIDQTEIYGLNRTLAAIQSCNAAILRASNEADLMQAVCEDLVRIGGYKLTWLGEIENDDLKTLRVMARSGEHIEYVDKLDIALKHPERGNGPAGQAIRQQQVIVCNDLASCESFAPWRADAERYDYKAAVVIPFQLIGKETSSVISIYSDKSNSFDEGEVKLLTDLVASMTYGINNLRGHQTV